MKGRITTLAFILLAVLSLSAQYAAAPLPDIILPAAQESTDTAKNVSICRYTLTACYPEQVCFLLSFSGSITITTFDALNYDEYDDQELPATIYQVSDLVYRAEISPEQWVEINAGTGESIVHQHCVSRVFRSNAAIYSIDEALEGR